MSQYSAFILAILLILAATIPSSAATTGATFAVTLFADIQPILVADLPAPDGTHGIAYVTDDADCNVTTADDGIVLCIDTGLAWDLVESGGGVSGDITAVGDCATGACFQSTTATHVLASPVGGGIAAFRALTDADVPNTITVDLATAATSATTADSATSATTATTASSLAADGANCPPGQWAAGVDASGASQGCTVDATGAGSDDQTAAEVPSTPVGGVAAIDVQAAIEELDAEHTIDTDTTCLDAGVDCLFAASSSEGGAATSALTASTATALAANGGNCTAGNSPLGVDTLGAVEGCFDVATQSELNDVAAAESDNQTAIEVSYAPTVATDWTDPDPVNVLEGLDDLAGRVTVDEAALTTHEGTPDAHFDHADTLAELNTQIGASLADGAHTIDTTRTDEEIQDVAGAMVTGNTESGIAVSYQDADGTFDFILDTLGGDATGPLTAIVVGDDSHAHADSTVADTLTVSGGSLSASDITLKAGTVPTAEGLIEWNTTTDRILVGDGIATQTFHAGPHTVDTDTDDQVASEVPFTPAGGIAATDVQAALVEVDSEHTVDTDTTCLDAGVGCTFAGSASEGGPATTALALNANGGNCSAGQYPLGVDASGAVEGCTVDDTGTDDQTGVEVPYTPTTATDWVDPDPVHVAEGLDDLAGRLTTEEAKADDDIPEAGDFTNLALSGDISSSGLVTTIGADKILESHLKAVNAAGDEDCLTYEITTGDFEWQTCGAGGSSSFADLTSGTNTTAAMIVGTGASLTTSGSGTITATDLTCTNCIGGTEVDESTLTLVRIGASTYSTVQHFANLAASSGRVSGGAISSSATANAVDVAAGTGWIRATDSDVAEILFFDWAASSAVSVPSGATRYLGIEYNAGSPQVVAKTSQDWDYDTNFPLGIAVNEGGTRYIIINPWITSDNHGNIIERFDSVAFVERDNRTGGLIVSNSGTRNVAVTAGTLLSRMSEFSFAALDTATAGSFDAYYRNGAGGWTKESTQTQWNNTNYDDGDGTLGTMTALTFASRWWYAMTDGSLAMLYGQENVSSLSLSLNEAPPASVPERISKMGILTGRFIIQASGTTPTTTQSAFGTSFTSAAVSSHNDLASLQGGAGGEYYHLTSAQNTLVGALDVDLATFSLPASTTISAFGASLIDDAAASNARTTLGLGTIATEAETNYALLAGRSGGQTLIGGTASGNDLTLQSTSNATKGKILFGTSAYDEVNNRIGIGTATPSVKVHVAGSGAVNLLVESTTANTTDLQVKNTARTWAFRLSAAGNFAFIDGNTAAFPFLISAGSPSNSIAVSACGVGFFGAASCGGGTGVAFVTNATTVPTSNSAGGALVYANAGALGVEGGFVANDLGADADFRVEGDTEQNLLFVDASTDRVGIGTATPRSDLEIQSSNPKLYLDEDDGGVDSRLWTLAASAGTLFFSARNDADSAGESYMDVVRSGAAITQFRILRNTTTGNFALFGTGSYGGGENVFYLDNRTTAPSSNPTGGGVLYAESGALKYTGSSGPNQVVAGLPSAQICLDNGTGSAGTLTLTVENITYITLDNVDPNACTVTVSETGAVNGQRLTIVNIASVASISINESAGVAELAGNWATTQIWDSLSLIYVNDRWIELSRSNN